MCKCQFIFAINIKEEGQKTIAYLKADKNIKSIRKDCVNALSQKRRNLNQIAKIKENQLINFKIYKNS